MSNSIQYLICYRRILSNERFHANFSPTLERLKSLWQPGCLLLPFLPLDGLARLGPLTGFSSAIPTAVPVVDQPISLPVLLALLSSASSRTVSPSDYVQYHQHQNIFDQCVIDIRTVWQAHSAKSVPPTCPCRGSLLNVRPSQRRVLVQSASLVSQRLALLSAVESVERDTFRIPVVQDFDSVAIEDGDNGASTPIR